MANYIKKYSVEISPNAQKVIDKLDTKTRNRISKWIDDNLNGCENPRFQGKALKGDFKGKWRYRVGNYRLIAEIKDDQVIILIVDVDKRNDIYKKKNIQKFK